MTDLKTTMTTTMTTMTMTMTAGDEFGSREGGDQLQLLHRAAVGINSCYQYTQLVNSEQYTQLVSEQYTRLPK